MKKFLFLLMSVAVLSASAGITKSHVQKKISDSPKAKMEQVVRKAAPGIVGTPYTGVLRATRADVPEGYAQVTLTAGDVWEDGTGYQMLLDADATAYGTTIPETGGLTSSGDADASVYAEFEYKIPENADGSMTTENIVINNSISILIPAGTYDWCITNPTPSDRIWIANDAGNVGGRADDYVFKSRCSYTFTVTLGSDGHDVVDVVIDDPTAPVVPEIAVTPAATSAYVDWEADANATGWNLRWRPWTDLSGNPHEWNFLVANLDEDLEGWWTYDMDGDGQGWGLAYTDDAETDACLISGSYTSSGACSPDNWIGTPDVPLKGELHFTMWGRSASYPEVVQVYAMVGEDLYQLFEDSLITTTTHTVYTVDLSVFEGAEGCIVFRNYSTYDQWSVYIDDVFIGDPNAEIIQPAAWNYEYNITDDYFNIEGLTPETKYEVQVQGYNADQATDWCDIVEFTTLAELRDVYMLGGDDQPWDCTQGTKFTYDAENNIYTLNYTFNAENNYFGFTTELAENNDDGGWAYIEQFRFGAIADEGTDYWYTGEEDFISLTWDAYHAIRIPAGEYNMTLDLEAMRLIIEPVTPAGLRGDVNLSGDVTIADVTALIDYLLSHDPTGISVANADCNLDENVTIADVTALIDYLLSHEW
ncbi:MAG: DUF2436 domain-containing protein [Muribaculaceae bacterium]|nr:DUF2436 domain-containing protein [Muribaculaceae bacterium]